MHQLRMMLRGLGRSAVDISAKTFLEIAIDRTDADVRIARRFVGCKSLANAILFCLGITCKQSLNFTHILVHQY